MQRGYILLWRCIKDNHFWQDKPFDRCRAWIDLLMLANHKEGVLRTRGISMPVLRGQVGWSEVSLSEKWGWSRGKVRRFLKDLREQGQIEQQNNNVTSLITITNYDSYQADSTASSTASSTANGQQTDSKRYPKKNVKEKEKEKEEKPYQEIIDDLNAKSGKRFSVTDPTKALINGRMSEGKTKEDFFFVHTVKSKKWKNDPEMEQYLCPDTLYRPSKFEKYLNERPPRKMKTIMGPDGMEAEVPDDDY